MRCIGARTRACARSAALFVLGMCPSTVTFAEALPDRAHLGVPRFDATPRLVGRDFAVPDPDLVWSTGEGVYIGVPRTPGVPWVWGGVDEAGVPWRATTTLPADTFLPQGPVQVITASRSLAVLYFGGLMVIRDGRAEVHSSRTVSGTFAHLASPAGRLMAMSDMPDAVFLVERDGTAAFVPLVSPRSSPRPAFVGETWALAYETVDRVDVVPSVGRAFSVPLRSDPPTCTGDERPEVRVVLSRWVESSFIDFTVDWRGGNACVRHVAVDVNSDGRPVRTVRYGGRAPFAMVARPATVEVGVTLGTGAQEVARAGASRHPTILRAPLVAADPTRDDMRVVVPRQRVTVDLFRIDGHGQVSEIARPNRSRCNVPECRYWPTELEATFIRWGPLSFPFTETGFGPPTRGRALHLADVAMFPEGFAWLGTSSRAGATLEYPRGTRESTDLGSGLIEPIALAADAHGSRLVIGDTDVVYTHDGSCWGPHRTATRVVVVHAADGTTSRAASSDFEGDVVAASGESQMGFIVTRGAETHSFVSDLGAPLHSLPTVPGTACRPTPISFAVDPPRIVYIDCAAETLDPFVRSIRFEDGRWIDVATPYRLPADQLPHGIGAAFGRNAVLALLRSEHVDVLRESGGSFETLASIPRAR